MKKGFTLIELLAVIVILAIIALIATPIVLNIISNTKENAQLRSAEMYLDAVEQSVMMKKMQDTTFNPNICKLIAKKLYCNESTEELKVEVDGEKPDSGEITFTEGKIDEVTLTYTNGKTVVKNTDGDLEYKKEDTIIYTSLGKFHHQLIDGTIETHEVTFDSNGHGKCSKCKEEVLMAGLYDENDNLVASWDTLVNDYELDLEMTYNSITYASESTHLYYILQNNSELSSATSLVIGDGVAKIGSRAFWYVGQIKSVTVPSSVSEIGQEAFANLYKAEEVYIAKEVSNIGNNAFDMCTKLTTIYYSGPAEGKPWGAINAEVVAE